MDDFVTQMLYDQGLFNAVEHDKPVFSKPIWKTLVHETRSADDRTRILTSKSFNGSTNPNIIGGIYTRPDVWVDDDMPQDDRLIRFCTGQCRFAHNGANRPIDALRGLGSVWWNNLWCDAAADVGIALKPTLRGEDWEWHDSNRKAIDHIVKELRHPFIRAVNEKLTELDIHILGQGGEFIILDQSVVDWDRTREASNFKTAHRRRFDVIKERMEAAIHDLRALIMELRNSDLMAMFSTKALPSKNCLVMSNIILPDSLRATMLDKAVAIATKHNLKLALTAKPFDSGEDKAPSDYGFSHEKGGYWFQ